VTDALVHTARCCCRRCCSCAACACQVIVTKLADGSRSVVRSNYGCEITKLCVFQDRFVVANTTRTLILGDLDNHLVSEVRAWFCPACLLVVCVGGCVPASFL
jgi:hypothetical protein